MDLIALFSRFYLIRMILVVLSCLFTCGYGGYLELTKDDFHSTIGAAQVAFVNFYADWCKFSRMLAPIFEETSALMEKDYPNRNQLVMARVDCDKQTELCGSLNINKYPTLKTWRYGTLAKREYRGQRSAEAFSKFLKDQLSDPITRLESLAALNEEPAKSKPTIIAWFENAQQNRLHNMARIATVLRDECNFYAAFGEMSAPFRAARGDNIAFKEKEAGTDTQVVYPGDLDNIDQLAKWINEHCVPVVREITFENAEELTEEGLPFLILFYNPDDKSIIEEYKKTVSTELVNEKSSVNFLTADGVKFSHPLVHLGKSKADLPLIAIDSFRHMFLFDDVKNMNVPGKLSQFIKDLHSGKLHRIFHYGFDPKEPEQETAQNQIEMKADGKPSHIPAQADEVPKKAKASPGQPPESTFAKLAPSSNRYTLLERDEL